jgi:hypothetical protein
MKLVRPQIHFYNGNHFITNSECHLLNIRSAHLNLLKVFRLYHYWYGWVNHAHVAGEKKLQTNDLVVVVPRPSQSETPSSSQYNPPVVVDHHRAITAPMAMERTLSVLSTTSNHHSAITTLIPSVAEHWGYSFSVVEQKHVFKVLDTPTTMTVGRCGC